MSRVEQRLLLLGQALRHRRCELGWTREELAKRAGYSLETIRRIERGATVRLLCIIDVAQCLRMNMAVAQAEGLLLEASGGAS